MSGIATECVSDGMCFTGSIPDCSVQILDFIKEGGDLPQTPHMVAELGLEPRLSVSVPSIPHLPTEGIVSRLKE